MKNKIYLFLFSLFLTLSLGSFERILACSQNTDLPSICEMYGKTSAVFVGKIINIKEQKRENANSDFEIIFQTKEAFVGVETLTRVSVLLSGTSLEYCGFEKGKTYLVYAYKGDKGFSIDAGTRTKQISEAIEDLEFLRNLPNQKNGIKIYGNVKQMVRSSLEDNNSQPLDKVSVKIENSGNKGQIFRAKTDADGNYELSGIPMGSYNVSLLSVKKDFAASSSTTMKINNKGCVRQDISVVSKSKIVGKVIDADGNPVGHINVEIISVNVINPDYFIGDEFGQTDSEGVFRAYNVPSGFYTISVNYNNPPEDEAPFPPTFYPGVADKLQAQVIEVNLGQDITDIELRLPPKLKKITIKGSVVWTDGTPAVGVTVYMKDHLHDVCCVNSEVITDAQGHFIIHGFEGRKYRVWAFGKRNPILETEDYGVSPPFILNEKTPNYIIVLDKTESWLTDMDDDNEKERQSNPLP